MSDLNQVLTFTAPNEATVDELRDIVEARVQEMGAVFTAPPEKVNSDDTTSTWTIPIALNS